MIKILKSQLLSQFANIEHFFTTRIGGKSQPPYQQANFSLKTADPYALENRKILANQLSISLDQFIFMQQIHSNNVKIVDQQHAASGAYDYKTAIPNTDALITTTPNLMLTITTADCLPILVYDYENKIIAAIHAGWRGTAQQITKKTIQILINQFNSKPENLFAAIGPGIDVCHYEIGQDVAQIFKNKFQYHNKILQTKNNKIYLDLYTANLLQLTSMQIPQTNIELIRTCTYCNNDLFYSHRKGDKGRQISGIMLKL